MDYRDLPYDAEVEYLQVSGNGYRIFTGLKMKSGGGFGCTISDYSCALPTTSSGYPFLLGTEYSNQRACLYTKGTNSTGVGDAGKLNVDWLNSYTPTTIVLAGSNKLNIEIKLVNSTTAGIFLNNVRNTTKTYFTFPDTDNSVVRMFNPNLFFYCKIYNIVVYDSNNILSFDGIPVRVGNVGYMYDKVSGQLFGNSGTGSFVLGPDVGPGRKANEVAFLESWGNQYIDTGIKPSTDTKIELKCLYCKSGAGLTSYGSLIGADDRSNAYILNHSAVANFTYGLEFSNNFANPQTRLLTFNSTASPQNMRVYDEGGSLVTTLTCIRGVFEVNQNLYLFAVNRNGTPVYGSNRILYCKIYDGNTLVRDYVPVEYNGVGYMYDKVSGLFFNNQGTGKFLFGSIAKACARSYTRRQLMMDTVAIKPYISNGLVFHLDGADFDGTTWHSRVGNYIATPHGNITKTSDGGVQFNGGTNIVRYCAVSPGITVKNNVGTIEVCAYRTQKNTLRYAEQIVDWGTVNMISYHVLAGRLAVATANYSNLPSPRAPIDYNIGKFTHSINNERQVFNGLLKELGTSADSGRGHNTIGGRSSGGVWNFIGIIYQIRIYNRHLTEEEMKWNQEQDRKRYGIQF